MVFENSTAGLENYPAFLKHILEEFNLESEGEVDLDNAKDKFTRDHLAHLAIENPVAYVEESKQVLCDMLSILFGL